MYQLYSIECRQIRYLWDQNLSEVMKLNEFKQWASAVIMSTNFNFSIGNNRVNIEGRRVIQFPNFTLVRLL